jgi:hypothetical protein
MATAIMFILVVAGEQELSASKVTYCAHQPVESSFTTKQENDNAALLRNDENSYVNRRTLRTKIAELLGYFDAILTKFSTG